MTAIERPLSPHLTVYRLPLAAWMSITHRMTGLALAVGVVALAAWLIAIALGPGPFAVVQDWAGSWL
ncbi:MAG: succinate dehydrogenase, cytochrome b556 subunit, partial [Pseudomonadota bacterium]|nr:succinate dehydrogenase, cytochrome b556 subunit [Pseudomonadota bacterium]